MKKFLFLALMACALIACDTKQLLESKADTVIIFRYVDETYKEFVITVDTVEGIYTYPKYKRDNPFFYTHYHTLSSEEYREYSFDICELATEPKVIALHDHYYMYYPYMRISHFYYPGESFVRDMRWENICDSDPLEAPVLCEEEAIYSEYRRIEGLKMDKITKKKRQEVTIDDIVNAINRVIDEGKLDKYSQKIIRGSVVTPL